VRAWPNGVKNGAKIRRMRSEAGGFGYRQMGFVRPRPPAIDTASPVAPATTPRLPCQLRFSTEATGRAILQPQFAVRPLQTRGAVHHQPDSDAVLQPVITPHRTDFSSPADHTLEDRERAGIETAVNHRLATCGGQGRGPSALTVAGL
jgi:hypothetical protein